MTTMKAPRTRTEQQVLDDARALLGRGEPQRALDLLNESGYASASMRNARGVCLLRLGKFDAAKTLLRELVFPGTSLNTPADLPAVYRANYAAAVMLGGDVVTGAALLYQIPQPGHPAVRRLSQALNQWKRALPAWRRALLLVGVIPPAPFTLDRPGDLDDASNGVA